MRLQELIIPYSSLSEEKKVLFIRGIRENRAMVQVIPQKVKKPNILRDIKERGVKKSQDKVTLPKVSEAMRLKLKELGLL